MFSLELILENVLEGASFTTTSHNYAMKQKYAMVSSMNLRLRLLCHLCGH